MRFCFKKYQYTSIGDHDQNGGKPSSCLLAVGGAVAATAVGGAALISCLSFNGEHALPIQQQLVIETDATTTNAGVSSTQQELVERCRNIDWQTACESISSAGARRHRRLVEEDPSSDIHTPLEEYMVQDMDDPSVVYDENCLRVYRLDLFGKTTFPYHANQLLRAGGNQSMALFIQHGAMRNADNYFCSFRQLMIEQHYVPFSDILVIAPDFNYKNDPGVLPTDAFWNATKPWGDWRDGAESDPECCSNGFGTHGGRTISSFTILDHMLGLLTNKALYPHMKKISYVGHSAGGQMVQRYAIMSQLAAYQDTEDGDFDVEFVVANPSSYTYLDKRRWQYNCGECDCITKNCTCNKDCTAMAHLGTPRKPRRHKGKKFVCHDRHYNRWPYGLGSFSDSKHSIPYVVNTMKERDVVKEYQKRDVVYILGQNDTCNDGLPTCDSSCWKREKYDTNLEWPCFRNHMDTRCPAMLQGPFRRTRGQHYQEYLKNVYNGKPTHVFHVIPGVGHNATGIFGSEIGLRELFD